MQPTIYLISPTHFYAIWSTKISQSLLGTLKILVFEGFIVNFFFDFFVNFW